MLLVFAAIAAGGASSAGDWASFLGRVLVLGPLLGALIGGGGATVMGRLTVRQPVREEYPSLFGIGLVLQSSSEPLAVTLVLQGPHGFSMVAEDP